MQFFTAAVCYQAVRRRLPAILEKRGLPPEPFLAAVDALANVVLPLEEEIYATYKAEAMRRIQARSSGLAANRLVPDAELSAIDRSGLSANREFVID